MRGKDNPRISGQIELRNNAPDKIKKSLTHLDLNRYIIQIKL